MHKAIYADGGDSQAVLRPRRFPGHIVKRRGVPHHFLELPKGITTYGGDRANIVPNSAYCKVKSSDEIEQRA